MTRHTELGEYPFQRSRELKTRIDAKEIVLAGNLKLKIYGLLNCASGKRMKIKNRVFFASEKEALALGYRPCGHCTRGAYSAWKKYTGS
jgi:methylphosphotriester-DNA--protein-cysteine methyltransferase